MLVKHSKNFERALLYRKLLVFIVILISFSGLLSTRVVLSNYVPRITKKVSIKDTIITNTDLPVYLRIPSINVNSEIYYVGLASDGSMDIKMGDLLRVAWYKLGPRPGEVGSAVIAGHYGWIGTQGSVFNNLHNLKPGDNVLVIGSRGNTTAFTVKKTKQYSYDANSFEVFKSNDNRSHLNLVTCYGTWIESKHTYSNRLVVFTDKN